ncbi:MAG: TPM domain-containing protein [Clostridia bacterium]|nr:TPM domain-containing protein [Clostridia bacterium]
MRKLSNRALTVVSLIAVLVLLSPFALDLYRAKKNEAISASLEGVNDSAVTILDGADLLTDEEETELRKTMTPVTAFYPVAFLSTDDAEDLTTESYAKIAFRQIFENGEGILFVIDTDNRYLYFHTSDSNTTLSAAKCDTIADNVYSYASDGDYARCAREAFSQVYQVMSGIKIPEPMKHASNALIALCVALFSMLVAAVATTSIKSPREVYQLDKNGQKKIKLHNVTAKLTRTYRYSNSSSSGGGGGRGGGGGGGGGGHGGGHGF